MTIIQTLATAMIVSSASSSAPRLPRSPRRKALLSRLNSKEFPEDLRRKDSRDTETGSGTHASNATVVTIDSGSGETNNSGGTENGTISTDLPKLTPYEKTLHFLANDVQCQKEITLGKRVGFYKIGRELGSGNFSKVRLAVHVLTKEKVAIKIMEKTRIDMKSQRLLMREISNMEQTHHPNIVRLFEVVETFSKIYLVQEYAGGGELYTRVVHGGRLQELEARQLFVQIASAVKHLHSKKIIHRDIKAENVFFSSQTRVKLGDFGFSIQNDSDSQLNTFCGSPPYAAPELFRDSSYKGEQVDTWATGILLFFMVTGNTPFRADTVAEIKKLILVGEFNMPEYLSPECQELIQSVLRIQPDDRYSLDDILDHQWLCGHSAPKQMHKFSLAPQEQLSLEDPVEKEVWETLDRLGVNQQMMRNCQARDSKHAIVGIYRITMYQIHRRIEEDEADSKSLLANGSPRTPRSKKNLLDQNAAGNERKVSEAMRKKQQQIRSKLCTIL